nr:GNAT family N-acetyltransferase [Kineosporia mesophila]
MVRVHELDGYPVEGVDDPQAWLKSDQELAALTAEKDGQVVGHVMLSYPGPGDAGAEEWTKRSGEPTDHIAMVGRLFIGPEARGDRLGARLTDAATEIARKLGRRAVLDVMAKDKAAIRTYEKLGWQRIAEVEHAFGDGQSVPAYVYVSPLE